MVDIGDRTTNHKRRSSVCRQTRDPAGHVVNLLDHIAKQPALPAETIDLQAQIADDRRLAIARLDAVVTTLAPLQKALAAEAGKSSVAVLQSARRILQRLDVNDPISACYLNAVATQLGRLAEGLWQMAKTYSPTPPDEAMSCRDAGASQPAEE